MLRTELNSLSQLCARTIVRLALASSLLFSISRSVSAQDQDWEKKAEAKVEQLKQKNGEGTNKVLRAQLLSMINQDQDVRSRFETLSPDKRKTLEPEMERTDKI